MSRRVSVTDRAERNSSSRKRLEWSAGREDVRGPEPPAAAPAVKPGSVLGASRRPCRRHDLHRRTLVSRQLPPPPPPQGASTRRRLPRLPIFGGGQPVPPDHSADHYSPPPLASALIVRRDGGAGTDKGRLHESRVPQKTRPPGEPKVAATSKTWCNASAPAQKRRSSVSAGTRNGATAESRAAQLSGRRAGGGPEAAGRCEGVPCLGGAAQTAGRLGGSPRAWRRLRIFPRAGPSCTDGGEVGRGAGGEGSKARPNLPPGQSPAAAVCPPSALCPSEAPLQHSFCLAFYRNQLLLNHRCN
ncbi:translation initiation factor IF-2-like [Schistocerca cancellata]|uniref:translation initiation factor IF-2-like n=1 Tax=Schistocerca cancellata TaxID=274614 RepID=UPI002118784B|nr:translation initiation factor IF-2-like [Schistocerca cancellata]